MIVRADQLLHLAAQLHKTRLEKNTKATQTPPTSTCSTPTTLSVGTDTTMPGIYISMVPMLSATVFAELANVLRMPQSDTATMQIELSYKAIPFEALLQVFHQAEPHWAADGMVATGLIRSMNVLNDQLKLENHLVHGRGCCKLVIPNSALVGRSILAMAPNKKKPNFPRAEGFWHER